MIDSVKNLGIRGVNHLVRSESWAQQRLQRHAGAQLRIEVGPFAIHLVIDAHGLFQLAADSASPPDVTLTCPPAALPLAVLDSSRLFAAVKLGGSVDVAESLGFVFRHLRWDAEGDLASVIGDIPAHRLVIIGQALARSLRSGMRHVVENAREYAVDEAAMLIAPDELVRFGESVNRLRDDVARLEKRLARL